jgi:hypothetical protein
MKRFGNLIAVTSPRLDALIIIARRRRFHRILSDPTMKPRAAI